MEVYGLTGGIGSGKSAVAQLLEEYGVPIVSADDLSRIVVARGSPGLADVVNLFGEEVLDANGELDRRKMAGIVFADQALRRQLEAILHPRIRERFEQVLDALAHAGHHLVVYEVPLLLAKNLQGEMKAVILVAADEASRIARVRSRDDVTQTEVRARIAAQMDEGEKRQRADYIVDNNGTMDDLRREVEFLLSRFLRVDSPRAEPIAPATSQRRHPPGAPSQIPTQIPDPPHTGVPEPTHDDIAPSDRPTIPPGTPVPVPVPIHNEEQSAAGIVLPTQPVTPREMDEPTAPRPRAANPGEDDSIG